MQSSAYVDAERGELVTNCLSAPNGPGRTVEGRKGAVAEFLDYVSSMCGHCAGYGVVVFVEKLPPRVVADRRELVGRRHDVCEEHGRQGTIDLNVLLFCADEGFDLGEDFAGVTEEKVGLASGKFDEARSGDAID